MKIMSNDYESIFSAHYNQYKKQYTSFLKGKENNQEIKNNLRLPNIRFRLTLSKNVTFNSNISYTKTERTRKIYKHLFKLNDAWFTYEAVLQLLKDEEQINRDHNINICPTLIPQNEETKLLYIFNKFYIDKVIKTNSRKRDIESLFQHLQKNTKGRTNNSITRILGKIKKNNTFNFNDIVSMSYALRIGYVHHGDAAGSGVKNFTAKSYLLQNLYSVLMNINVILLNVILKNKLNIN